MDIFSLKFSPDYFPSILKRIKQEIGLKSSKWDELISPDGACSRSFIAIKMAKDLIIEKEKPLCIVTSLCLVSGMTTTIHSRNAYSQSEPKPFGEGRDGHSRTECVTSFIFASHKFAAKHNLRNLGKIRSAVGGEFKSNESETSSNSSSISSSTSPSSSSPTFMFSQSSEQTYKANVRAMREALRDAQIEADSVSLVELHGPSTVDGDIVEYDAFKKVYCEERIGNREICVSTTTSILGNTESASGFTSLLKVILSLKEGILPGVMISGKEYTIEQKLNFELLPRVSFPLHTTHKTFKPINGCLYGAVNSFGMNAYSGHLIVQVDDEVITSWNSMNELACFDSTYITHPTMQVLKSLSPQMLSNVKDFSIQFENGNRIEWLEAVDLTFVGDISTIVTSTNKAVTVFPNRAENHKKGEGINHPMRIYLQNLKNINDGDCSQFVANLKQKVEKFGAVFLWYKEEEGCCCFEVKEG
jgi:3-oxoacyl-(acyl-carrier-protein) synthase